GGSASFHHSAVREKPGGRSSLACDCTIGANGVCKPSLRDFALRQRAGRECPTMTDTLAAALEHFARRTATIDHSPRIVIDGHCNVLWQSPQAERLLRPPLPLWIRAGKLHADGGATNKAWPSFVENVGGEGERLLLTGRNGGSWVLVRGWGEWHGEQRLVFIKCALSLPLRTVASSGLSKDFGLTRSECAVLDDFATLAKPDQI